MKGDEKGWFVRPGLARTAPNRGAGNLYRAAADNPDVVGGVPLDSVEAAVTAAVRLGYKIAEAQIDRTARLATRLREAGDQAAGPGSDRKALDATEQLVFKAMMSGLAWVEGVVADRANPVRRLASAQFRLLGSILGLLPAEDARTTRPATGTSPAEETPAVTQRARAHGRQRRRARVQPLIKHDARGRAVQVRQWELSTGASGTYQLTFFSDVPDRDPIEGRLHVSGRGSPTLTLATSGKTAPGLWKAAVCDGEGVQIGYIEVAL